MKHARHRVMALNCSVYCLSLLIALVLLNAAAHAQSQADTLTWNVDAASGQRFVAAHGRRAVLMGYEENGLEFWAYPVQIFSGYTISFRTANSIAPVPGIKLLRRIEYHPDEIVRIYVGLDFVVREHLFVPLDAPAAILSYEVEGRTPVTILAHFMPSMNPMWPAAWGGQAANWDPQLNGYRLVAPANGVSATISSPQSIAHDATTNFALPPQPGYTLELKPVADAPAHASAQLVAALDDTGHIRPAAWLPKMREQQSGEAVASVSLSTLESDLPRWQREYRQQIDGVLVRSLEIETPDEDLNRALRWAELALDEAWVCNGALGCGEVAGYGPSRAGRRPQYDWFFAGDGLVATEALLHTGEFDRARAELRFIAKFQNLKNGMIWHELSQSAAMLNWTPDYPYMYVHVDTTFQYLATMGDFFRITGDTDFVRSQWDGLKAAYAYCGSVINPSTGLPQIPAGQEGEDEQDRLRDELGLSAEWFEAARAYAALAGAVNDTEEARAAKHAADRAKLAIAKQYWDTHRSFWIAGHTVSGAAIEDDRVGPTGLLSQHVFSAKQTDSVLDRLSSPAFMTDWGERGMSSDSPNYDPNAYSRGTVSLLGSTSLAMSMWTAHRPVAAWELWRGLDQWNALDSAGHLHELLAGDFYHPEYESVPEQTWSSAGFVTSAVAGLLGLEINGETHTVRFAPHLPPQWNAVTIRHLRIRDTELSLHMQRTADGLILDVDGSGSSIALTFSPELPLGAVVESATINGKPVSFSMEDHPQDEHVTVAIPFIQGSTHCAIHYRGGVAIAVVRDAMHIGDGNSAPKVVSVQLQKDLFTVDIFVSAATGGALELTTGESLKLVSPQSAARIVPEEKRKYLLLLSPDNTNVTDGYQYLHIQLSLGKTV